MEQNADSKAPSKGNSAWLDFGPLLVFFVTNWLYGIYAATGALIVAVALGVAVSWKLHKKIPPMMIFTAAAVGVFGGLTIWLQNETFIKLKVTIINVLLAAVLLAGHFTGRSPLKLLLGDSLPLTDEGWRGLTVRYASFFLILAAVNELVWRNVSTDTWVNFKVFGVLGLTLVFTVLQAPFLNRHLVERDAKTE